jgi:ribonuclease BN (tRNA processing enzyme)
MPSMSPSHLHVLGACGAWPEPGSACSGFVIEHDGYRLVLDLGYGTLPRLLTLLDSRSAAGLDAVVVTHAHPDHMIDLHGLFRARWFGDRGAPRLPLHAPPDVMRVLTAIESDDDEISQVFDFHPLPADAQSLGPFTLTSHPLPHFIPNLGVRLESEAFTLAYTGDTGPTDHLATLGRGADLFIVEATDRNQRIRTPPSPEGPHFHLTSQEAGRAATAAGARRLLLTHFWPGNDREASRAAAAAEFDGEVLVAEDGLTVSLD